MKLAYLSASQIPSRAANSVHVMKMCQAFSKNGHQVTLYARTPADDSTDVFDFYGIDRSFEIEYQHWPVIRGLGGIQYARQVKHKIQKKSFPELFYGRDLYSLWAAASLKIPFIYESHGPPSNKARHFLESQLFKKSNFKKLVVISQALKDIYQNLFPDLKKESICVAHDGADLPECIASSNSPTESKRLQVGYVGHLYPGRGIEIVIELAQKLPDLDFHVVGGMDADIQRYQDKPTENLQFHGFSPHGQLDTYYRRFDILLAPYQQKVAVHGGNGDTSQWMSPLKIFEYMAYGKPVIASDLPALKEVLQDGVNSLLCEAHDVGAWLQAIEKLRTDLSLRVRLGEHAYQDLLNHYTWSKRASLVLA